MRRDTVTPFWWALRVLLIAGPSSSGKSSTAQRLATQLQVNGFKPVSLSLDNYFLDRAVSPRDAEGNFDFDTIDALNLPLLRDHLSRLVDGEAVDAMAEAVAAAYPRLSHRYYRLKARWLGLDFGCGEVTRLDLHDWGTLLRWFNR